MDARGITRQIFWKLLVQLRFKCCYFMKNRNLNRTEHLYTETMKACDFNRVLP